eukprot:4420133-Prorocentrum_lima.AAC.1
MDVKYDIYMQCPTTQNLDEVNKAEETLLGHTEYQACKDYGGKQVEDLKAMDFMDILTDKL